MTREEVQKVIDKGGYFVLGEVYFMRIQNSGMGEYFTQSLNLKTGNNYNGRFTSTMESYMKNLREATPSEIQQFKETE